MMPLTMANTGEVNLIKKVGGNEKIRRFWRVSVLSPALMSPLWL